MAISNVDQPHATPQVAWTPLQKNLFRVVALYFLFQIVPLAPSFWRELFTTDWGQSPVYQPLFQLAKYTPNFFGETDTLLNWGVVAGIAALGAVVWAVWEQRRSATGKTPDYDRLNAWLRILLRYRLAAGLLAFGLIKLFPLQAPEPSLSQLNTPYGEMTEWKIFALTLGIVPSYQSFLGAVETLAGLLLLTRRSATIGASVALFFTGNIFMSNLAYEGGEYVYSFFLITIALYLLAYDALRMYTLLVLGKPTAPNGYQLVFDPGWQQSVRLAGKAVAGLVILVYSLSAYGVWREGGHHYPTSTGQAGPRQGELSAAAGFYTVREFRLNGQTRPPSPTDSLRWQNVVVERWNTLSIRRPAPAPLLRANRENIIGADTARHFEWAGQIGRHYYRYNPASGQGVDQTLLLRNPQRPADTYQIRYDRPDSTTLVLRGINARHDSIYAVLERVNRKYLLAEAAKVGRRKGLTL